MDAQATVVPKARQWAAGTAEEKRRKHNHTARMTCESSLSRPRGEVLPILFHAAITAGILEKRGALAMLAEGLFPRSSLC